MVIRSTCKHYFEPWGMGENSPSAWPKGAQEDGSQWALAQLSYQYGPQDDGCCHREAYGDFST